MFTKFIAKIQNHAPTFFFHHSVHVSNSQTIAIAPLRPPCGPTEPREHPLFIYCPVDIKYNLSIYLEDLKTIDRRSSTKKVRRK